MSGGFNRGVHIGLAMPEGELTLVGVVGFIVLALLFALVLRGVYRFITR